MKKQTLRWLIPITPAGEGWGAHRWSIRSIYLLPWGLKGGEITICDRNLAKLPFVTEIERFRHQRHFWKEMIINWISF